VANVISGLVSVIIVNFRGADDTMAALAHLRKLDWDPEQLEIIVVENGSQDDSAQRIRAADGGVHLIESKDNLGFAGGCNLGAEKSNGEFLAFLNNDARPDPSWISAAVASFRSDSGIGAVASKVLDWTGEHIDYAGSALTWFGMGYKPFSGHTTGIEEDTGQRDVLFGTGSAMFVRADVFQELGGFDERYFMFFEDVDFGWRLNLRGWRYRYVPESVAYHRHHASMKTIGSFKETYLLERNALYTLYKNLGDAQLSEALPAALALTVRRAVARGELDSAGFDIRASGDNASDDMAVSRQTLAGVYAVDQFVEVLPSLRKSRTEIQDTRVLSDEELWPLFGSTDAPSYPGHNYLDGYENIVATFDVLEPPLKPRVLIVTGDPVGAKMAGPAIRAWHMAQELARVSTVKLVSTTGVEPVDAPFDLIRVPPGADREFDRLEQWADIVIFQGHALDAFRALRKSSKIVVADIYDPMHLEQLEQAKGLGQVQWDQQVTDATESLNRQLERGDFFLCASERQKHFYLGQLATLGRITPTTYEGDPDFDGLISVVPFGLESTAPEHTRNVVKGVVAGIGPTDRLILWSGGLYNWFDPKTLIEAIAQLSERHDDLRLFFLGTKHPNPSVPEMAIVRESRELSDKLGLTDKFVFFNDTWVEYEDRQNYLLEADLGVSTHFSHIETTFSFRTRILDYLWARLPMVVTEGDFFGDLVAEKDLGEAVPARDPVALAAAIERVLYDDDRRVVIRQNIERIREEFVWERTLAPLVEFVQVAQSARDRRGAGKKRTAKRASEKRIPPYGLRRDLVLVVRQLKSGGPRAVASKVLRRLRNP
jgi:GT2 family glycosyltransferase/glycosyltransferase involved in cell wall biosynthesis